MSGSDPNASFDELPDPLEPSAKDPLGGSEEDLLSQLAGDEVDRLLSADSLVPLLGHGAVQEMKSQIGTFFDELQRRQRPPAPTATMTAPDGAVMAVGQSGMMDDHAMALRATDVFEGDDADGRLDSSSALLAAVIPDAPEPFYLKSLNWLSDPIASLSHGGRALVGTMAVISFVTACAALAYVLVLTNGQG